MKFDKEKLKELAKALQKATKPDRKLDMLVHELCVGLKDYESFHERGGDWCLRSYSTYTPAEYYRLPAYTKSIDDALKLLPEKWTRAVDATAPEAGIAVDFFPPDKKDYPSHRWCVGDHKSEAIATCIAAVKARIGPEEKLALRMEF